MTSARVPTPYDTEDNSAGHTPARVFIWPGVVADLVMRRFLAREPGDFAIVAEKQANKAGANAAEPAEPRAGPRGTRASNARTGRGVSPALGRVRKAARQWKKENFMALLHHINLDLLRMGFLFIRLFV